MGSSIVNINSFIYTQLNVSQFCNLAGVILFIIIHSFVHI